MGSINGGFYFNVMHMTFEISGNIKKTKKITNITIEGPIPVCEKVFENVGRCNYLTPDVLETAGPLVNWKFHDKDVYPHPVIQTIY